jgi:Response regulators consisting of a CheY-like receiver domain and a winged-helix DNA-binding domain
MRILVIEDNKDLCDSMCFQLQNEGYATDTCYTGEHALFYAMQQSYDVIILDRMLPVMDGLTILKKIREKNINVPVIMVTAMDGLHDRIDGLDSGADDYLVKPLAIEELLARIRALIRRPQKIEQTELLHFSNLELDVKQQHITSQEKTCSLSKRETELMEYFMRNSKQTLTREMILSHVWGPDNFVEEGNLDNYIHFLRRRLKSILSTVQIKTLHGVGYRLEETTGDN